MRHLRWLVPLFVLALLGWFVYDSWRVSGRAEDKPVMTLKPESIRIEIVNASGVAGAGVSVRDSLAAWGFDVYAERKDRQIVPRTRIVDRRDQNMRYARELQRFLTVPAKRRGLFRVAPRAQPEISCEVDSLLGLEVKIVLGEDYRRFFRVEPRPF